MKRANVSVRSYGRKEAHVTIGDWQTNNNPSMRTLRGVFSITIPGGYVLNRLMLHSSGKNRWIELPSRGWIRKDFGRSHLVRRIFRALDNYFETNRLDAGLDPDHELAGAAR